MSVELFSLALGEISECYIEEALSYQAPAKHIRVRSVLRMALAACLTMIMVMGMALVASAELREVVFGWLKEPYKSFTHYEYNEIEEPYDQDTEIADVFIPYELTEVPPGFEIRDSIYDEELGQQVMFYWNEEKGQQCIVLACAGQRGGGNVFVEEEGYTIHPVEVAGVIGDLYIPDDPTNDGCIVWMRENMFFFIAAHFTPEEFVYYAERLQPALVQDTAAVQYQLGYIPAGYTILTENRSPHDYTIIYSNDAGLTLSFFFILDPDGASVFVKDGERQVDATVHGEEADLQLSEDLSKESSSIVWVEDDILFSIAAYLPEDELIALAESVEKVPLSEMEDTK